MKIRNRHSEKEHPFCTNEWFNAPAINKDLVVIEWGDPVYLQTITASSRVDERIVEREEAIKMIDINVKKYSLRELTEAEWTTFRNCFHNSPDPPILKTAPAQAPSFFARLLEYAPVGIWITGIISILLMIFFNACN